MTDIKRALKVKIPIDDKDTVKQFDELLSSLRKTYFKAYAHSIVPPDSYEYVICQYNENSMIEDFLSDRSRWLDKKLVSLESKDIDTLRNLILL